LQCPPHPPGRMRRPARAVPSRRCERFLGLRSSGGVPMSAAKTALLLALGTLVALAATAPAIDSTPPREKGPFDARLLDIARTYATFGRVDDEARWAPHFCRAPRPAEARFSASKDRDTHGQKLYSLFARDRSAYLTLAKQPAASPVGQVLVKESWVPEEIKDE